MYKKGSKHTQNLTALKKNLSTYIFLYSLKINSLALDFELGSLGFGLSSKYTATAKSLQSCPTLCDPIDGSKYNSSSLPRLH